MLIRHREDRKNMSSSSVGLSQSVHPDLQEKRRDLKT